MSGEKGNMALLRLLDSCAVHGDDTVAETRRESFIGCRHSYTLLQHRCVVDDCGQALGWEIRRGDHVHRSGPGECADPSLDAARADADCFGYVLPRMLMAALAGLVAVFGTMIGVHELTEPNYWAVLGATLGAAAIAGGTLYLVCVVSERLWKRKNAVVAGV